MAKAAVDANEWPIEAAFVAATVERLHRLRAEHGNRLPAGAVTIAAMTCGVAPSTMRRYLAQGMPKRRGPTPWSWGPDARAAYFRCAGSVRLARETLIAEGAGEGLPSEVTMYRAAQRDFAPDERAMARSGERAARARRLVCAVEQRHRNEVWLADHKLLNVGVRAPDASHAQRLWMTAIIDGYSRRLVGASLSTTPNCGHVLSALGMAIRQCGVPEVLLFDHGREFLATAVTEHAAALGYQARPTAPYSPHLKGKIERVHQTINRRYAAALGTVPRPATDRSGETIFKQTAPSMAFATQRFFDVVQEYNDEPHRALDGRAPATVYAEDPTPERPVDAAILRRFLLAAATRRVTQHGVQFQNRSYYAPELEGHRGVTVEIRWAQDDRRTLEIYRGELHWCTARLVDPASPEQHRAVMAARREHGERCKADLRLARRQQREQWKAISEGDGVDASTPITRSDYLQHGASAAAANLPVLAELGIRTDLDDA